MQIVTASAQKKIRLNYKKIKAAAARVLGSFSLSASSSLCITFVSNKKIKQLNNRYFKKNTFTDVIALGYAKANAYAGRSGKPPVTSGRPSKNDIYNNYLGDIIVAPEVVSGNAKYYNNDFFSELTLCVAHGILHLLGYDNTTGKSKRLMRRVEREILSRLKML